MKPRSRRRSSPNPRPDCLRTQQKPTTSHCHPPRPTPRTLLLLLSLPLTGSLGCASPGPPRSPSLHLAATVSDLSARRIGDSVVLHWTTPSETTDSLPVPAGLTAELCRTLPQPAHPSPRSSPIPSSRSSPQPPTCLARIPVQPGPGTLTDPLPPTLLSAPTRLLAYRIQIFNAANRSAGPSPETFAPAGPALPPIRDLRLTSIERGVRIEWPAQPPPASVDLDRLDLSAPAIQKSSSIHPALKRSLDATSQPNPETHLRAEEPSLPSTLAGTLDTAVAEGSTYRYTARRLRSVNLAGHDLELRSLPSAPAEVTVRDTFPPRPPQGLAAVPSILGQSRPNAASPSPSALSIDLSWEPNTEPDLAGYLVYRASLSPTGTPGSFARLTPNPIAAPAFCDLTIAPNIRYAYRITAVDTSGNESPSSTPVQESSQESSQQP